MPNKISVDVINGRIWIGQDGAGQIAAGHKEISALLPILRDAVDWARRWDQQFAAKQEGEDEAEDEAEARKEPDDAEDEG